MNLFDKHETVEHETDLDVKRSARVARVSRDVGIERASDAAGVEWREKAIEFVRSFLERNVTLHVDQLWASGLPEPTSPRALGAVIQHAVKERWIMEIRTVEGFTAAKPSIRSNMQLKPVWRSLLYHRKRVRK